VEDVKPMMRKMRLLILPRTSTQPKQRVHGLDLATCEDEACSLFLQSTISLYCSLKKQAWGTVSEEYAFLNLFA